VGDRDVAAAAIADIAILEVARRNAMDAALERLAGQPDWYRLDIGLNNRSLDAIARDWGEVSAASHARPGPGATDVPGSGVILEGGDTGKGPWKRPVSYEDLWRAQPRTAFPGERARAAAERAVHPHLDAGGCQRMYTRFGTERRTTSPSLPIPLPEENRRISIAQGRLSEISWWTAVTAARADRPDERSFTRREEACDRRTRVGYDYLHSMIDDFTRLAYSEICPMRRAR
jgi:hypothetical protein